MSRSKLKQRAKWRLGLHKDPEDHRLIEVPKNYPSKELQVLIGSKVTWDHSYCCGHHPNDPHMRLKIRGIRRSKLKQQFKQILDEESNDLSANEWSD